MGLTCIQRKNSRVYKIFPQFLMQFDAHMKKKKFVKFKISKSFYISFSKFLYPSCEAQDNIASVHRPGQCENLNKVDSLVRHGLGQLILNDTEDHNSTKSDSLLGGALARALCHIH